MGRGIEGLARPEELTAKVLAQEGAAASYGAMQNEHGIADMPGSIARRFPNCDVVETEFNQFLARMKQEIPCDPVPLHLVLISRDLRLGPAHDRRQEQQKQTHHRRTVSLKWIDRKCMPLGQCMPLGLTTWERNIFRAR